MKVEGRKVAGEKGRRAALALVFFVFASPAWAQKKPKPALKEKAARDVILASPGFALNKGAVRVREVSPAGAEPVTVVAEVTEAFRFARVEDERAQENTGLFKQKRWRAVEFRTGDRSWEEFEFLAAPLGAERVEAARRALEELATEFEARQARAKDDDKAEEDEKKAEENEPLTRGPLTIKQLSPMGSSAVAEVTVEATFRLARDARGKWRVSEVLIGGESLGDAAAALRSVDAQKAERARAEMRDVAAALESFRRERGFYVVAEDAAALMDHLSPRHLKSIVRIDPWHRPYRYAGTREQFSLSSDGPDGKPGTADDVPHAR